MAALGVIGATLAKAAAIGGTVLSTIGTISAANNQNAAADFQARQLEIQGKTENALAQREAQERRRQSDLRISRAKAVAAASGGGQDYSLLGDLEEEGELNALNSLWEGQEAAKGRQVQAASARFSGAQAKKAGSINAFSTALDGGISFYDKYG